MQVKYQQVTPAFNTERTTSDATSLIKERSFPEDTIGQKDGTQGVKYPFMVSLHIKGDHVCTGTLINYNWVLTSAYCISDQLRRDDIAVLAGECQKYGHPLMQTRYMKKFLIHQGYDAEKNLGDVGMAWVQPPFHPNGCLSHVTLPQRASLEASIFENDKVTAVKWNPGHSHDGDNQSLREETLTVVSSNDCKTHYPSMEQPNNMFICTTKSEKLDNSVSIQSKGVHFCGGSLVTWRWILTATHCIRDDDKRYRMTIMAGSGFSGGSALGIWFATAQVRYPREIIQHPNYSAVNHLNDIALLSVTRPFYPTSSVLPLSLPSKAMNGTDVFIGKTATAVGWGRLYEAGPNASWLKKVTLPIIGTNECRRAYFFRYQPNRMFLCTHVPHKDACQGDSGGPLLLENVIIGIVAYGMQCADPMYPGVFIRVDSYLDWIKANAYSQCYTSSYYVLFIACVLAFS